MPVLLAGIVLSLIVLPVTNEYFSRLGIYAFAFLVFYIFSNYISKGATPKHILILVTFSFSLGFFISNEQFREDMIRIINYEKYQFVMPESQKHYEMPILNVSPKYFNEPNIKGWRADDAIVDEGYQSFPTTTISLEFSTYSNEVTQIPAIKSHEEIFAEADILKDTFIENIDKYGDWAKRYLPEYNITDIKEFDVNLDGKNELIISLCSPGANHCPFKTVIVKNGVIIFSTTAGATGPEIVDAHSDNGFYLKWAPWKSDKSKWDVGLCCMPGYMKTRFVFDLNGTFKPVYEQEVLFFKASDS